MAAIPVVAADVRPLGHAIVRRYTSTGVITPGQAVAQDAAFGLIAADSDLGVPSARAIGIAIANGDGAVSFPIGARVDVVVYGPVTGYSGMTNGEVFAAVVAGTMDQTAGARVFQVGYAESATTIFVRPMPVIALV